MQLTALLTPAPEGGFDAFNPETGCSMQGDSIEEALDNLREATSLYLAEFPLATGGPPHISGAEAIRTLEKLGFVVVR